MSHSLFIDIDCSQIMKYNQNVCGDAFKSYRFLEEGRLIAALSDGLGSGVKANILATMTATMALKFIEAGRNLLRSSEVMMESLPICQVRKISYATFSLVDCDDDGKARIVEEGNPEFLLVRNGKVIEVPHQKVTSEKHPSRKMQIYEVKLEQEDRLIFCSDGVTQAGLGNPEYKLGWRREGLIEFVESVIEKDSQISSRELSTKIVQEAITYEPDRNAKDDTSSMVLYFRKPRELMVFTGSPYWEERDGEYAKIFADFQGKKAICGGTTANILSRELNTPIESGSMLSVGNLPAISYMKGVDLVTEGILTLTQAVDNLENGDINDEKDAASRLVNLLIDSDCIKFMVGAKLNEAHYDPDLPIELGIRKTVIKRMVKVLRSKYLKEVNVKFI